MPKFATTPTLSDYPKITISDYKKEFSIMRVESICLNYVYLGQQYRYEVSLSTTPCNYGKHRYWFSCPQCGRRVATLYCMGQYVCRHCVGLHYKSQLIQPLDRLFSRVSKIRQRLQWQQGIAHGHGNRPKGMHQTTFDRLVNEHDELEQEIIRAMI